MASANGTPTGYYVGRPMSQREQGSPPQPPAAAAAAAAATTTAAAVDEPVNAQVPGVPGYYAARVNREQAAAGVQSSAPPPASQPNGQPGLLTKFFGCLTGGGNAR
ncbi:hypothetical protein ACP70R_004233 [Stipagrostis hirtigluma subsp. patula]